MWQLFLITDLKEFLPQLNVSIRDGSNVPALDPKLNGGIATITYLCTASKSVYPVYKFIDWFVRPLLDILKLIHSNLGGDHVIQGNLKIIKEFLQISFVGFMSVDPMVYSCITFLVQDAE